MEILVPRRYGQLSPSDATGTPTTPIKTIDEIIAPISNEKHRSMLSLLVKLWQGPWESRQTRHSGASFQAKIGEKVRPIFWTYPHSLQNALGEFSKYGLPEELLKNYRQALADLPGFNRQGVPSKPQPITKLEKITEQTVRTFVNIPNNS